MAKLVLTAYRSALLLLLLFMLDFSLSTAAVDMEHNFFFFFNSGIDYSEQWIRGLVSSNFQNPTTSHKRRFWAAVWAILMFHYLCGRSHKTVSINHKFWKRKESRSGSNRGLSAYQPSALPLGHMGSLTPVWEPAKYNLAPNYTYSCVS